jgi:hypothetical protein
MTRIASLVLAVVTTLGLAACDKPNPEDCRKALLNMQHLLNTESFNTKADLEGEVRRCRGGSKRTAVQCAIKATTLDELRACDFEKVPGKAPLGSNATVSPAPGTGSAAPAAPAGSAAPAAGSAH